MPDRLAAACLLCAAWGCVAAQDCPPSRLGQPCPAPGAATLAGAEPALNLGAGNPTHIVTGNKTRRDTDMPSLATAPGLELVRHYNAQDPRAGPLGKGWTLSYDTRLYLRGGMAQVLQADGSRIDLPLEQAAPAQACTPRTPARPSCAGARPAPDRACKTTHLEQESRAANATLPCAAATPQAGRLVPAGDGWTWHWPDGRRLAFDTRGRLARISHPSGISVRIERDGRPGPTEGEILSVTDETAGMALRMHYETGAHGARLAHVDTPAGRFTYDHDVADGAWRLVAAHRPDGMQRRYLHEASLQGGAPAHALTGVLLQDANGRALRLGAWGYDAQGRVILATAGAPDDAASRMTLQYRLPAPGRDGLTRIVTRDGVTLLHTASVAGRYVLKRVEGPGCPGCAAPGSSAVYDAQGRLARVNGLVIDRDGTGEIVAVAREDGGWPGLRLRFGDAPGWSFRDGGWQRRADPSGRALVQRDAGGDSRHYQYDAQGRPTAVQARSARPDAPPMTLRAQWEGTRIVRAEHPHEIEDRQYDAQGRLRMRRVVRPPGEDGIPGLSYREYFVRDARARVVRHELPEGGALAYHWDARRLAGVDWIDAAGRSHTLLRRPADGGPGYEHGNGLRTVGWLRAGKLAGIAVADRGGQPVFAQTLAYDEQGRIIRESLLGTGADGVTAYGYDAQSRLAVSLHRTRTAGPPEATATPALRRFYAWHDDGSALHAARPRRDASGLPVRIGRRTLHYDALHRLQAVREDGRLLQSQRHNAYGQRIFRRDRDGDVHYLYADGKLAAEARTVGRVMGVTRRYVYAGWTPVAMIDYAQPQPLDGRLPKASVDARIYAIHTDAVGAPRVVTDADARVRWRADLDPLGRAHRLSGELALDLRLPGQVHDPATGWHHNGMRVYDPAAGHYLEADPLGPLPVSQAYGYAAQQPRRHVDPLGLLLFAFDGTGNDPASMTNVWLLAQAYAGGTIHYQPGPAADGSPWDAATAGSAPYILALQWERLLADLAAARWAAGPVPIDLLGYSRGAALARHFANQIADQVRNGRFWTRDALLGVVTACVDLRFMGLFDTVAQFGILGSGNAAYDFTVSDAWHWVAHAVALHELRWLFPLVSLEGSPGGNFVEAPFVGAHGDIGGGYLAEAGTPAGDSGDLSDVALNWMHWQARTAGVPLEELPPEAQRVDQPVLHDPRPAGQRNDAMLPGGDRRIDDASGATLVRRQHNHPRYGQQARQATESFIDRLPGWMTADPTAVGVVDMQAYRQWLAREVGYRQAP